MKTICVLLLSVCFVSVTYAQRKPIFRIGAEVGSGFVESELKETWNIRQDVNFYDYGYHVNYPYNNNSFFGSNYTFVGIKPQVSFFNDRLNVYSGVRMTMFYGGIGSERENSSVFLRTNNTEAIEYYKITSIDEKAGYLSIPLEVSYNLLRRRIFSGNSLLAGFFKVGAEIGTKVYDKQEVRFESPKMQVHEKELLNSINPETNSTYATLYSAIGAQLTARNGRQFSIELTFPSKIQTNNNFSLTTPTVFSGFQFSVQFPVNLIF
ncbi:MAG: hypothetical protein Q4G48_02290 [Bacteroidia bacterium]|nr:hypothetical protein [Bacteroidia bacterium]